MKAKAKVAKSVAFKALDGATAINSAIASIAKRGKSLDKDVHIAAVSCLIHADKHGDVTLATRLVEALPSQARKNPLRDWFLAYGKFGYDQKNKAFTYNADTETLTQEAMETPFWEFKPEAVYVPFDINEALNKIIAKAEKAMNNGDNVDVTKLEALRKIVEAA